MYELLITVQVVMNLRLDPVIYKTDVEVRRWEGFI